ncbi:DNA-directed RNA polymerase sigma-70 factor [Leminorella grimontii]|uniref:DNA-directed RNA polymerase sigma-70 factor n=1 Tax=Leminorella grimontii TaxID=82981 RepID=A0AAV5N3K8_9GAMM|nr:FliA/WhiG family RNA polymerase sigma factor [Leminorella grimontii]KFC93575.1 RNA polymerase sigma factor [Leminorella grimontii ATCC 33999 = DSM 5078]GKX55729.1 DNA-directed RNA polymerase sigma-70 factor [Leminorella grimontii]GKX59538.1 DNA-directed RNA polymerase sigma-70 factor [Leminorella grimontii]VFS55272.1 Sigma-F factor [Leminorella grimontii]
MQAAYCSEELTVLTPEEENRYLQAYLPLVRKIVRQLAPQCSSVIDRQDMEQIALIGLLNAIRRYGAPDEAFGSYAAQRVRGAILDELRSLDWRPRQLRQKCHQLSDLLRELRKQLGREPEWEEIAAQGVSVEDYQEYLQLESAASLASLDEILDGEGGSGSLSLEGRRLDDQFITQRMLKEALDTLSEKERLVLMMYYQQDMNLKEIALVLDVTEARVCQMNKKISEKIREFFD